VAKSTQFESEKDSLFSKPSSKLQNSKHSNSLGVAGSRQVISNNSIMNLITQLGGETNQNNEPSAK